MKIIIIEGCDNLGKSTLISNLVKYYNQYYNVLVKHSGKPSNSNLDLLEEQSQYFLNESKNLCRYEHFIENGENKETIVIYDRFVQGEYVWGSIYRNYNLDDIKTKCVQPVIDNINVNIGAENIVSILLDAPSHFIYYNDDGQSFCSHNNMNESIKLIDKQRKIFKDVMTNEYYNCFKNNIIYNVHNDSSIFSYGDFIFKNENTILEEITKQIKEKINI